MLLVAGPGSQINLTTGAGVSSIYVHVSYVDIMGNGASATVSPATENTVITTATTTTVADSPPVTTPTTERNVKLLNIFNSSAAPCVVEVVHTDGTTPVPLKTITLLPGYSFVYEDLSGWYVSDANGNRQGVQGQPGTDGVDGTDGTNGTNAGNAGTATLDFGAVPGSNTASAVVTGQTSILSTSTPQAFLCDDTTVVGALGHNAVEHQITPMRLVCGSIVPGVGFTIYATSDWRLTSTYQVRFVWN